MSRTRLQKALLMKLLSPHEEERLKRLSVHEEEARAQGYPAVAGVDEAGRGPLAGPVVAAACILPEGLLVEGVDDSKKLTPRQRMELYQRLTQDPNIVFGVGIVDAILIDQINILQATFRAMLMAVAALSQKPDFVLVDGSQVPNFAIPMKALIKGDSLSQSIAAASIIAKHTRDQMMLDYHSQWPHYGFDSHKGYGTQQHLAAIQMHGACPIHRLSFYPLNSLKS